MSVTKFEIGSASAMPPSTKIAARLSVKRAAETGAGMPSLPSHRRGAFRMK